MARQYLIPGWGYINETSGKQYLIPGQGFINETQGGTSVTGTIAVTEGADVLASSGIETISGSASLVEGLDVLASTGTETISGTATIIENLDVLTSSGLVTQSVTGTALITEIADILLAVGNGGLNKTGGDDAWHPEAVKRYKAAVKKRQEALQARESEKLSQLQTLRNQIRGIEPFIEESTGLEVPENVRPVQQAIIMSNTLEREILEISEQIRIEARRLREEDDIQVLLLLL